MFCKNCGKEVSDGTKFCPNCGAQLGGAEQQASGTQQTTYTGTVNGAAGRTEEAQHRRVHPAFDRDLRHLRDHLAGTDGG